MSYKDGRVALMVRVDPALRDRAKRASAAAGLEFSRWVERALEQALGSLEEDETEGDPAQADRLEYLPNWPPEETDDGGTDDDSL